MELSAEFLPNIVKVNSSCGCTLTNASFRGMSPNEFQALSGKETNLAQVIAATAEAKALGVKERGLSMLLKSSIKGIKPPLNNTTFSEQSIIMPYIQRPQRRHLNADYFRITASAQNAQAGVTLPAGAVDFTVQLSGNTVWSSPIKNIERYFLPDFTIFVLTWDDNTDRNSKTYQYRIVSAVNVDADTARVTVAPLGKVLPPATPPAYGTIQIGANNISDWEYHCQNQPSNNNRGLIANWFQTTRSSRCVSQVYKETLAKILSGKLNAWDQHFNYLALADQNKQGAMLDDEAWLKSVFYNDYISDKQTVETYDQLETIEDPEQAGCTLEYKANALGIFTMLGENNRILDMNGGALDLEALFEQVYYLKKYREADGDRITVIDGMTDRKVASMIFEVMAKYFKARYNWDTTRFAKLGEKVEFNGVVMFEYDLYDLPDQSVQLGIFREPFFDDQLDAYRSTEGGGVADTATDFKNRARAIWFIDWSDISVGIGRTKSVVRKSPNPDVSDLYKCRINANIHEYSLRSQQWTVFLDRPYRHLVIQNFSLANPIIGGSVYSVPTP